MGNVARQGARSSLVSQTLVQVGSAVATVVLARLLTQTDFGIIAAAQSVIGIANLLGLGGITAALVTRGADVQNRASSYFWAALLAGCLASAAIILLAYPIANALGVEQTAIFIQFMSLTIPLSFVTLVPQALLQRELEFIKSNRAFAIGAVTYFVMEVSLALMGLGAWAVVLGQILGAAVTLCLAIFYARFKPKYMLDWGHLRVDANILGNMSLSSALGYVGKNVDYWVVSRTMGASALGTYYISYVLPSIVRLRFSQIFRQVMLPILAGLDSDQQAAAWREAARRTLVLVLPALSLLAAVSDPLIATLFGRHWGNAVLPMQLITAASMMDLVFAAVATLALVRGPKYVTRSTVLVAVRACLMVLLCSISVFVWKDIAAVAAAAFLAAVLTLALQEIVLSRPLGVGTLALGRGVLRLTVVCIASSLITIFFLQMSLRALPSGAQLFIAGVTTMAIIVGLGMIFCRSEVRLAFHEGRSFLLRH